MPCYDSRDEQDRYALDKRSAVLTVLLCAVMTEPPVAELKEMAQRWLVYHAEVDRAALLYKEARTIEQRRALSSTQAHAEEDLRRFEHLLYERLKAVHLLERS